MYNLADGTPDLEHLQPLIEMFDIEHCKVVLPSDRSLPFVQTRAEDVGKFVAASPDPKKRPEFSQIRGSRLSEETERGRAARRQGPRQVGKNSK
ncbi:uncharacterized protein PHACADRAFT_192483 [Phanerochaete carnosa HHB-10118-sp]|uniref:Uncharacterized protein n=1 Tax=Phanerochaete carnosa (strain HHB-10118-sp) TaxID=650164 RepID=K5WKY1_PHACS|nr:uncharacterized protein PHACADRAFT_192483 [Phanerochaete carnosa HHB-10118-sp]EKM60080.1 hypothetical protein PHACADRAFT_192483 [Phanerochaete carnosa HHB-10118-sp]